MLQFDANLYRIVMGASSKEEPRYYLQGALVEPHAKRGVVLVATDGQRLIAIHDENGKADESAIIKLSPEALKACKRPKIGERIVQVDGADAVVRDLWRDNDGNVEMLDSVALTAKCRVDGTFPDWRRVIPQDVMMLAEGAAPGHFNGGYLADMGQTGIELEKHLDRYSRATTQGQGVTRVLCTGHGNPALVLWDKVPQAFGVLMPIRGGTALQVPDWFKTEKATPVAA